MGVFGLTALGLGAYVAEAVITDPGRVFARTPGLGFGIIAARTVVVVAHGELAVAAAVAPVVGASNADGCSDAERGRRAAQNRPTGSRAESGTSSIGAVVLDVARNAHRT